MKKIIYIVSDVRSGSSMLDNMISNHPEASTVGELHQLYTHIHYPNTMPWGDMCTCQEHLTECHVWRKVFNNYQKQYGVRYDELDARVPLKYRSIFYHMLMILAFFTPIKKIRAKLLCKLYRQKEIKAVGKTCYKLFRIFMTVNNVEIVIDSSKTTRNLHALILAKPDDIELKVIHIIRDGRAVLFSKIKRLNEKSQRMGTVIKIASPKLVLSWAYANLQIKMYETLTGSSNFITIKYEDLINETENILLKISEISEISYNEKMIKLSGQDKHNIGGTPHRFTWHEGTKITSDDRWKTALSKKNKFIYCIFGAIFHKLLGESSTK
ncbi:hypothetical protein KKHLCK_12045 [Candidatus Electrothrix laxa]